MLARGARWLMIKGMLREVYFHSGEDPDARVVAYLDALCPACGFEHSFAVDLVGHGRHTNGIWSFNGDYEKPTFTPSMGANLHNQEEGHPRCHSHLRSGIWRYLDDCTHNMANHHVPMIPPDPDATFEKRHGWHLFPWTDDEGKPKKLTK